MTVEIYALTGSNQQYGAVPAASKVIISPATDDPESVACSLRTCEIMLARTETSNPAPQQEESRKPDTGFAGLRYTYNVLFEGNPPEVARLRDWFKDRSIVRSDNPLPNGRFGVRDTDNPEFDIHPTRAAGLKLVSFTLNFNAEAEIRDARIILEHSGAASRIGVGA